MRRTLWLALAAVAAFAAPAVSLELTRGPAVGRPDSVSVSISWTTDRPATSRVEFAGQDDIWSTVSDEAAVQKHVLRLFPLASGALYCYRVYSDDLRLGHDACFRAPRSPLESSFQFAVIGDTAGGVVPSEIAAQLVAAGPDLALHTGDVVYPDGAESAYDQEFFRPFASWLERGPILPTIGNHDAESSRAAPLLDDFVLPRNDATGDSRFYALRQGGVLFVCLDVETTAYGEGSAQYSWLVKTLAASDAVWKIVYFHEPPFSSDHANLVVRLTLSPVFERYGVDVVLSGHAHLYERTFPIRMFASEGPGVVYVTEGGGGAVLSTIARIPESAFVEARVGYLLADVDGGRLFVAAHGVDGSVFDSFALEKPVSRDVPRAAPHRARPRSPTRAAKESR